MKKLTKVFSLSVLFAAVGSLALPASAEIAVIVNSSFNESVDADKVTKLFLGKDKSLTPIMAGGTASDEFIEKVLSRTPSQYKAYWAKLAFTGGGRPPQTLDNTADIIKEVASDKSKIGVIDAAEVTDSVKVLHKF